MNILDHRLSEALQINSPNQDSREDPLAIELLVIHCISLPPEQFAGHYIDDLFCNRLNPNDHPYFAEIHQLKVSAHLLIRRDGSLRQYVPFDRRAWHAGVSCYEGRERCNDFSIGIELEGSINQPYTDEQYQALAAVTRELMAHYPGITSDRITGHSDIAPDRKNDPGRFFDWARFRALL